MAKLYNEETKSILFTICLTTREIDEQVARLRRRNAARFWAQESAGIVRSKRDNHQMKKSIVEFPPINTNNKEETCRITHSTPVGAHLKVTIEDNKISRMSEKSRQLPRPKKELPQKSIRQAKPNIARLAGSAVQNHKRESENKANNNICLGDCTKARETRNHFGKEKKSFRNKKLVTPGLKSHGHETKVNSEKFSSSSFAGQPSTLFTIDPPTVHLFRPWPMRWVLKA